MKAETLVVLVNVLYFKDDWKDDPFDEDQDLIEPFTLRDGATVDTNFMESDSIQVGYQDLDNVEIVSVPFKTDGFHFVVVSPKDNSGKIV